MNEATVERLICFVIGCAFGYILHVIVTLIRGTKEEVDELLIRDRRRDQDGILQHRAAFNVAFAAMMVFVLYAAYASFVNGRNLEEAQKDTFVNICKSGQNSREVQRAMVDAIYNLAIGAIQEDPDHPFTKKQIAKVNDYIDRTNAFRESTYKKIRPTETCTEYVTDDNVEPPTPPQPHF